MASVKMKKFKEKINNNKDKEKITSKDKQHSLRRSFIIKSFKCEYHVDVYCDKYINERELRFILDDLTDNGLELNKWYNLEEVCDIFMKVKYLGSKLTNGCMVEKYSIAC